ncbi:hypothetical protein [Botrimarina hoheduenensis]|uniref:Uncharacterized protein n=1 Tax=Botrimarina hoheduenensis TaxID=2528000 RepID=A0A5C5W7M2_9BACT|nr:hypothetical protein [Botrimarina hoheduenensis]TWT46437.1 hypothetical protein Pla111_15330 [Botrimarina hoheduenensis]
MLAARYRRLWKRRFRRRPLLPFLLAATLAIDLALTAADIHQNLYAAAFFLAQMSLLAMWVVSATRGVVLRGAVTITALVLLIELFFRISDQTDAVLGPALLGVMASKLLTAGLVSVVHRATCPTLTPRPRLRFSMGTLLVSVFCVALVSNAVRNGDWSAMSDKSFLQLVGGEAIVVLIMASLHYLFRRRRRTWFLVGLPAACLLMAVTAPLNLYTQQVLVYSCAQALVMGIWLASIRVARRDVDRTGSTWPPEEAPLPLEQRTDDAAPVTLPLRIDLRV